MIKYNWQKVYATAEGKSSKVVDIIHYITHRPVPKNNYDFLAKRLGLIDWDGDSFLLNPNAIFENRHLYEDNEIAEYVALASFRSLSEYIVTKRKTLSERDCPVDTGELHNNKLLSVHNGEIYFKWEETTH